MIDTLHIYQDLAESLGDAAARKLASVLGSIYQELQQSVTKEDFRELKQAVAGLAEAQGRTEAALVQLAEAHTETRRQLGGLAMTVGYTLENAAYRALPALLERDFGLTVEGRLKRGYLTDSKGQKIEVNLIGEGIRAGRRVALVGEGKSQLSANDVERFERRELKRLREVLGEVFPILITHMTTGPEVEEFAKARGVAVYYSYDF